MAAPFAASFVFALALLLRLNCLDCKGLWYDEVASLEAAGRGFPTFLTDRFGWMSVQTPLHYFIVWLTSLIVDPTVSAIVVRLPSALAGAAAVALLFAVGRELYGRTAGIIASCLLAFSAIHIGYSQDVRPYALITFFTLASVYCLLVAERTRERRWWALFVIATIFNLYLSYFALTFVLPALAPYAFWAFLRLRKKPGVGMVLASFALIVLATVPILLDLASIPRSAPDLGLLTPSLIINQYVVALTQLTKLGIGGTRENTIQWIIFTLALLGTLRAVLDKRWNTLILCLSFLIVPCLLMAVFRTGNTVFQRYILFILPFYLLLMANGVLGLSHLLTDRLNARHAQIRRVLSAVIALPLVFVSACSAWIYFDPTQYRTFGTQPDYRGVARYLQSTASPDDVVIIADEPALGATVLGYYLRDSASKSLFDARDPRLPGESKGSVYLVVSFFQNDATFLTRLGAADNGWSQVTQLNRVAILKWTDSNVTSGVEHLEQLLARENAAFQPVITLRGSLAQLASDLDAAANRYRVAGVYFGTGNEYFRTAEGYLGRGDRARAWREALISKFMEPGNPAVHDWFADRLTEEGLPDLAAVESEIAQRLRERR